MQAEMRRPAVDEGDVLLCSSGFGLPQHVWITSDASFSVFTQRVVSWKGSIRYKASSKVILELVVLF